MDVFDFAMKVETDGKAYYEKLAAQTDLPGLQTIFACLAQDEQKHFEIFKRLKEGSAIPPVEESSTLEKVRHIFETLPLPEKALANIADSLEAYRHAMKIEADSLRFYEEAANEEKNPQIRKLLLRIAAEEQQHFNIMDNVFHFVNAPNQYLAGAEFSNLDEVRQFGRDVDS